MYDDWFSNRSMNAPNETYKKSGGGEIYEEKGGILHFESFCLYIKRASEWSLECMC